MILIFASLSVDDGGVGNGTYETYGTYGTDDGTWTTGDIGDEEGEGRELISRCPLSLSWR